QTRNLSGKIKAIESLCDDGMFARRRIPTRGSRCIGAHAAGGSARRTYGGVVTEYPGEAGPPAVIPAGRKPGSIMMDPPLTPAGDDDGEVRPTAPGYSVMRGRAPPREFYLLCRAFWSLLRTADGILLA